MTRTAFFCILVCLALAALLASRAWRHSRPLRAWLRAKPLDPGDLAALAGSTARPTLARVRGVLEPAVDDALVPTAPFSERRVLWVRAELRGSPPGSPVAHPHTNAHALVLWERSLNAPARVASVNASGAGVSSPGDGNGTLSLPLDHPRLRVFAAQEYRHGVVRTLTRVSKVAARALVRAGYVQPPPPGQLFTLEEEVLQPGDEVLVFGLLEAGRLVPPPEGPSERSGAYSPSAFSASAYEGDLAHPLWVTNLPPWRVALRLGWAPVLALWLALLCVLAAGAVLGAWLVAR